MDWKILFFSWAQAPHGRVCVRDTHDIKAEGMCPNHSHFGLEGLDSASRDEDIRKHVGAISKIPLRIVRHFAGQGLNARSKIRPIRQNLSIRHVETAVSDIYVWSTEYMELAFLFSPGWVEMYLNFCQLTKPIESNVGCRSMPMEVFFIFPIRSDGFWPSGPWRRR